MNLLGLFTGIVGLTLVSVTFIVITIARLISDTFIKGSNFTKEAKI